MFSQLLVHRDLRAAVHLAAGLPDAADGRARPQHARDAGARAPNLTRLPKHAVATIAGDADDVATTLTERLRGWRTTSSAAATPSRSPPRRAICASSATWSSISRCWVCWSRSPPASCSATRATSSSSPTGARASARHRPPRSTRSGRATPSTARRCIRSACASTTSRRKYLPSGQATSFAADIDYQSGRDLTGGSWRPYRLEVNHPLRVGGDRVYLQGHGYAPTFTVDLPRRADPHLDRAVASRTTRARCCPPASRASTRRPARIPTPPSVASTRSPSQGLLAPTEQLEGTLLSSSFPR